MTLGVDVTSRDNVFGWESIKQRTMTADEKVYRRALADYFKACDDYLQSQDFWQDMRETFGTDSPQALNAEVIMHRCSDIQDRAEERKHRIWMQMNCPHTHTKSIKDIDGNDAKVCILCGAIENEL